MSGAGKTPYSRGGDGRAALSNAAREFFAWHGCNGWDGCNGRFHRCGGNIIRDKWDITNQFDMIFGSAWGLSPPQMAILEGKTMIHRIFLALHKLI